MKRVLNLTARPSRFLKLGRSIFILLSVLNTAAFATPTTPTSDFIDNGDGTVTHKKTGLMWMRCSIGQAWDNATSSCTGTVTRYSYDQAMTLASSFAGKTDWRLPNIAELHTIIERDNYSPAVNNLIFPNTPIDNYFWSSTPYAGYDVMGWLMSFTNGKIYMSNKPNSHSVRLVRAGQPLSSVNSFTPNTDFTDNSNGTVTHKRTGLTWMRCAMGQTWENATASCTGSAMTYSYDQAMALSVNFAGLSNWRLPNANELLSIIEYGTYPAVNSSIFSNAPSSWFWSSSSDASFTSNGWIVYFSSGEVTPYGKSNYNAVRLVSSGQVVIPATAYDIVKQASVALDFGSNYDAKNAQVVVLKNTSSQAIKVSNVTVADAENYWVNLFADSKTACRPVSYTQTLKNFTIPAKSSCKISVGFSPFNNLTAGKALPTTITLKTVINGIATDKAIQVTGLGRAQVANAYNAKNSLWGQNTWAVAELKGANPPINTTLVGEAIKYSHAKFWYGSVIDAALQKPTASVGNVVVFASNSVSKNGHVGVVIQTSPVVTMLSMNDTKDSSGVAVRRWSVRPIAWYPNKTATWLPLITGFNASDATKHYGFIDWNSSLY